MTFDLISGLHMQIQTWHPPLRLCIHAKYYVKSGLTNVLKNANKTKNMHLFSIRIANYIGVLGQVWCLIVLMPDLCPFSYFVRKNSVDQWPTVDQRYTRFLSILTLVINLSKYMQQTTFQIQFLQAPSAHQVVGNRKCS